MSTKAPLPEFRSFGEVARWVIDELGAMCPSPERLARYASDPQASDLADVRYHVDEARCRLCQLELEHLRPQR